MNSSLKNALILSDLEMMAARCSKLWPHFQGKNILVTGGGGFLGFYFTLLPLFMNQHHQSPKTQVYLLDLPLPSHHWAHWLKTQFPELHLLSYDLTENFPTHLSFDWIIHAAGIASPSSYRKQPLKTLRINVHGLENIMQYSREHSEVQGILSLSTSEIYGNPPLTEIPTSEEFVGHVSSIGPRACYDESKRLGETLAVLYHEEYGVPVKITRPFNHYGPGLFPGDGRVMADFAQKILAQENLLIHSDGGPTRSFCYIADAIVGHYHALALAPAAVPINIGHPGPEISIADLAELFFQLAQKNFQYPGQIVYEKSSDPAYLTDNPQRRCPRLARAQKYLAFEPQVSLSDGIQRYLTWCHDTELG